jgi:hypothetical protein
MKNSLLIGTLVLTSLNAHAEKLAPTTFSMSCVIISPDDKWTYRDYGFELTYRDSHGKQQTLSAKSTGTKKNCTNKTVSVTAAIPASKLTFKITDFTGEKDSTIECTNTIAYHLAKADIGKVCEFMVKTPKYGAYTSTDECALEMHCDAAKKSP